MQQMVTIGHRCLLQNKNLIAIFKITLWLV